MTDIVERLRDGGETCGIDRCSVRDAASGCACAIAADEIERLRKQVRLLKSHISIIEDNAHHCLMLVGGRLD